MINWIVPAIWLFGVFYSFYDVFMDGKDELKDLGEKIRQVAGDQPGKAMMIMVSMAFVLNIVAICWPILTIIEFGMNLYEQRRSKV